MCVAYWEHCLLGNFHCFSWVPLREITLPANAA